MTTALDRLTWRSGAVLLVALVLLLGTGQRALAWQDERAQAADAKEAVAAATAEVEGLVDISSATSQSDMAKLLAGATAGFRTELAAQADRLQQALTDNAVRASGDVVSAGIVKLAGDRATVIVAAAGSVQNKQTTAAEPRNYRLTVDLQRVKGDWLVSGLEFVA
ncbi:hypothetical protein [Nocardioides daeguensis]|uniref:Mce-associated membrane protein n=1 Tax=Nocardioides daeguensis TaxID=908359 RepID=A0ABP6VKI1_9ACTN|nr:hypothetical protein [Nocardioides daeguensis]MBV6728891.1 hypothetical protein [Nocardioides daeguensis]MCR1773412.1 hypothetical protein [Nocardioides daeguensis]